ncbi:MAG TPA: putative baseplate assembly protein [Polyangia bacterium]|nr:putative baseplate assembly protein [Polyangia bacterium]
MLSPAPQYRCTNQARARLLAADASFAGVTLVEVPEDDDLAPRSGFPNDIDLRGRILFLHLPVVVQNGLPNMLVQGGVTITDLPIAWGASADALLANPSSIIPDANEAAQVATVLHSRLSALTTPTQVLVVRTIDVVYNGIDFLEVLDTELSAQPSYRQMILLVHLFLPVPTSLERNRPLNLEITGGVRIPNVNILWSISATHLMAGPAANVDADGNPIILNPPDDFGNIESLVGPSLPTSDPDAMARILVVRTDVSGDFSPYELEILDGSAEDADGFNLPLFGFDSQLSRVTFSFKVECKSDFDCLVVDTCPPPVTQAPIIDYLSKDYASFKQLMLDRLSQTFPQWTERSEADIGITIVELLAYAADQLSYFQDTVSNEAYLGTARHRPSLRRHARLLNYTPSEGTNARAFVHIEIGATDSPPGQGEEPFADGPSDPPSLAEGQTLPAHTPLISLTDGLETTNVTDADLQTALNAGSQVFETMAPLTLHAAHNRIPLYTWGDDQCCLPKGAVRATLDNTGQHLVLNPLDTGALVPGTLLAFEEVHSPNLGAPPDPKHRQVVRLTGVRANFDPLTKTDVVDISWAAEDALTFPLCLSVQGSTQPLSIARGNIVLADHGHSVLEVLPLQSTVRGNQRYIPNLTQGPMTFQAQVLDANQNAEPVDSTAPAAEALTGDPTLAVPQILLFPVPSDPTVKPVCTTDPQPGTDFWTPVSDLLEAGPFTQSFVVEMQNDGTAQLRFGDGTQGLIPTEPLFACYRVGNGTAGNVGADSLVHIVTSVAGVSAVWNVLPAAGGADPEPAQSIQLNAPQAFRIQERAVTEADYSDVALRHPGVQRAVATRRFTGSWYTMFVAVDRLGGLAVDDAFKTDFAAFLERFRLAGYDLEIQGAISVPLKIKLTVCVQPGFLRANVEQALDDALSDRQLPNGQLGFFHPDNFTFGQPVFRSRILAAVLAVPGVASVITTDDNFVFQRLNEVPDPDDQAQGLLHMDRLEIARLDNDPSQPENGTLELVMLGGT